MDFEIVEIYLNCWGPPVILFSFSPFLSLTGEPTARMVPLVGLTAPSFSLPRTGPLSLLRSPTRDVCAACPAPPLPGRCYPEPRPTMPGLKAFAPLVQLMHRRRAPLPLCNSAASIAVLAAVSFGAGHLPPSVSSSKSSRDATHHQCSSAAAPLTVFGPHGPPFAEHHR
jgi:hypothetical protein